MILSLILVPAGLNINWLGINGRERQLLKKPGGINLSLNPHKRPFYNAYRR